jgi:hypothetical protein
MTGFIELFDTARDYTLQFTVTHTLVSSHVLTSRCLVAASNLSGLSYHLLTTHNDWAPAILLLNWSQSQSYSYVTTDGQSASLPWCQAPSWAQCQILVAIRELRVSRCGVPSLTRGRVTYNCYWPSSTQLFLRPSPAGLMTIFYCLRFEAFPTCRPSLRDRVAHLYPQALGSLIFFSYDSPMTSELLDTKCFVVTNKSKRCREIDTRFMATDETE